VKTADDWYLLKCWIWAHLKLDSGPNLKAFFVLRRRYHEQHRAYHVWHHIAETIRFLKSRDEFGNLHFTIAKEGYGDERAKVILALFFHDAVYDPAATGGQNERDSVVLWKQYHQDDKFFSSTRRQVENLILLTIKHKMSSSYYDTEFDRMSRAMLDADMSIFLADSDVYLRYAKNIWLEYQDAGKEAYTKGRLAFLESCNPQTLFQTAVLNQSLKPKLNIGLEKHLLENDPDKILVAPTL
jgi:predicted metal-dependent HD superfamily phosphohydrolase